MTALYAHSQDMSQELTVGLEITPNDVKKALEEQGIDPSQENIERACLHLEGIARDWAKATLQDEKDWKFWLEDGEQGKVQ